MGLPYILRKYLYSVGLISRIKFRMNYYRYRHRVVESGLFDSKYYLKHNPDVGIYGVEPLKHYMIRGASEGRNPGPDFITSFYLHQYRDVANSGINPLLHFILYGQKEKRLIHPFIQFKNIQTREELLEFRNAELKTFLAGDDNIVFPDNPPSISVILVLFNQAGLTLACLKAIKQQKNIPFEIIIVDNNSTDATKELLEKVRGATLIKNEENKHFLAACNQALEVARGESILLLNNDTTFSETTFYQAYKTLHESEEFGAVGARIVLPTGLLQEAGSIIWQDGSCTGYGRSDDPDAPEYNFRRVVDYVSGAFLMTKTALFRMHGGFDPQFSPAYYEETDYCLWLQKQGYKVIYDPMVRIDHFEFASSDMRIGTALQKNNNRKFQKKHASQLKKHFYNNPKNLLKARFSVSEAKKPTLLYIDDRVPHRNLGSGFPRANSIVNEINLSGRLLTLLPLTFPYENGPSTIYTDIPPNVEVITNKTLEEMLNFIISRKDYYDVVWVSRPHNLNLTSQRLVSLLDKSSIVYDAEAIFVEREYQKDILHGNLKDNQYYMTAFEHEIQGCTIADCIVTVSDHEAKKFRSAGFKNIHILGHALQVRSQTPGFHERSGLLFVGNLDHPESPNVDSILWFIDVVWPRLTRAIPGIILHIVGTNQSPSIRSINKPGVIVHGCMPDVTPMYDQCRVFIAPTRFAAGIPFKIHEAAAHAIPVVATSVLGYQLGWENEVHLMTAAAEADTFADQVIKLYTQEETWNNIRQRALVKIMEEQSETAFRNNLLQILNSLQPGFIPGEINLGNDHIISLNLREDHDISFSRATLFIEDEVIIHQRITGFPAKAEIPDAPVESHIATFNIPDHIQYSGQRLWLKINDRKVNSRIRRLLPEKMGREVNNIKVMGERASATNYLFHLLRNNFPNVYLREHLGWKHGFPSPEISKESDWLFIVVFRDPFDWIRSLYLQPHHVHPSLRSLPFSEFIRAEWHCIFDEQAFISPADPRYRTEMMQERDPLTGKRFKNVLLMRNAKVRAWLEMSRNLRHSELICYENLRKDPESYIRFLSEKYLLPVMPTFMNITTYKGITDRTYKEKSYFRISQEDYKFICETLDFSLEAEIGYTLRPEVVG